jgi:DNA-binding transcriptional regulator YiaG
MPNIAQALKAEIVRISRKEVKASVGPLHNSNVNLRKTVKDFKGRIAALEADNKRLQSMNKTPSAAYRPGADSGVAQKARITSKGVRKLREKLGLTQDSFAKLLGVTMQAVYAMEHKSGRFKLRPATLAHLISVRAMGKREAKKRLEELGASSNKKNR